MAIYFCTGEMPEQHWRHYALNVERYTHFTSPIRRYPDVLVHRQLAAALEWRAAGGRGVYEGPDSGLLTPSQLSVVAQQCNVRKGSASTIQVQNERLKVRT